MKLIEILNLNRELLIYFQKAGIRLDDVQYIDLFNEYRTGREGVLYRGKARHGVCRQRAQGVQPHTAFQNRLQPACSVTWWLVHGEEVLQYYLCTVFKFKTVMNKYHQILQKVLAEGKCQQNKKGNIRYLLNERLVLSPADLLDIFEGHGIARKKLRNELQLFMQGERNVEKYREVGINWWDYCGAILVNSYPTYFEKLPPLIARINREKRNSKNYVLFLGSTDAETNQAPCLSLVQFQIENGELVVSAYQRSSDANLGLPADIYHLYLMARQIDLPLKSITLNLANVHIYENNISHTRQLLDGNENVRFELNV